MGKTIGNTLDESVNFFKPIGILHEIVAFAPTASNLSLMANA